MRSRNVMRAGTGNKNFFYMAKSLNMGAHLPYHRHRKQEFEDWRLSGTTLICKESNIVFDIKDLGLC